MAKIKKAQFIESLKEMSIKEVMELVGAMKDEFGIDPTAAAAAPAAAAVEEAPTEVTVTLKSFGGNKVAVIKVVKALTGIGLMDAKKLVESAPNAVIKADIKPEEAEDIKGQLIAAGAEVSIA